MFKASGGARNLNFGSQPVGSQNVPPQPAVIANTGDAALSISGMSITGPNTPDFSLLGSQSCIGANLAPQQQCSFEVAFVPSKAGPEEAFVAVSDNAPGNPQLLALVAGYTPPFAVPSPSAITFATIPQGSATASQRITLLNSGNQVLVFASDASIAGADRGQFKKVADTCFQSQNLAADTSCYVDVAFAPVASGQFQAQLQFIDNSSNVTNSVQSVSLSGMATPGPVAALNPLNLGFSEQGVGTTSSVESISLMNAGSVTLNITNVSISGPDAASFGLVATGNRPCPNSGGTLGSGLACTVGVDFTPQSSGVKTANLVFSDNASGSPQMVPLTGTGTMPAIQLSPTSLTFGSAQNPQPIGVPSAPQNVTVTSTGSSPLSLNTITISGTSDFSIKNNNCPAALGTSSPNNACTISVAFTPSVPGTESASLTINDNAPGSPHSVALSGTGAQQSAVSVSPNSVSFGNEIGGTSSAAQTLTVKNTGNGALAVSGISFSGTNPGDFSEKDTCTGNRVTIAPNATCTVSVTFAPANNGSANANLVLTDNAPDSPESVPLSGSGVDFTIGAASGAETTAKVTAGQTAMYSLVVAGGAGSVQLACSGAPSAAACSAPASAAAGTPFMVSVSTRANSIVVRRMPIVLQDPGSRQPVSLVLVAFAVAAIVAARRRSTPATHVLRGAAAAILFAIALVACGGGGGDPSSIISGTPPGQYTVTITGSAGGTSHSVALTLVVH